MYSGTRNTDLLNTLLNRAYVNIAAKYVKEHYGIEPEEVYRVHQGDDVWLSNRKRHWAALIYYTLNQMGLVFNPLKQMFGTGRGEFLRAYCNNGYGYGYVNRCIFNYLLRPLQGSLEVTLTNWTTKFNSSFATMHRRVINYEMLV